MADATATARGGQVRSQRCVRTMSRGCWRLVVLLGLSWIALILLGGTAQASDEPAPSAKSGQAVPLLGKVLSDVGTVTAALPVREVTQSATKTIQNLTPRDVTIPEPVAEATDATASAVPVSTPSADLPVQTTAPVQTTSDAVAAVGETVKQTAEAAVAGENLLDVHVPSLTGTVAPLVDSAAAQLDATTQSLAEGVGTLAVPLPIAASLPGLLDTLAGTVDRTTDVITSTTHTVTASADAVMSSLTQAIAPLLEAVTGPLGSVSVGASGTAPAAGATPSDLGTSALPETQPATAGAEPGADQEIDAAPSGNLTGPAVPPPDSSKDSTNVVAQPATDIVTAVPVPVSAAGSTTGNGGSAPGPALDQTLVRVDGSEPVFEADVTEPIEGPAGPMPGTPSADPAFSPD